MLFNSAEFLFVFLPIAFLAYFWLTSHRYVLAAKAWLVVASLAFYGWWNVDYLPLIIVSTLVNFAAGRSLALTHRAAGPSARRRVALLSVGVSFNLALLGYYKYADFLVANLAQLTGQPPHLPGIVLPLAISFFTFTQIAYLVDSYRGETKEYDLLNYALFVTFFPHLIAGPIVHHRELMPQFARVRNWVVNHRNLMLGLFLLALGLFKKVVLADSFAVWATAGFDDAPKLALFEAWRTSLSYTFQLYFDFSGYTDMALGASLLFNIRLPINFNSPYRATDIQDFWRRWHITLSRFLRDYLYIPLGGNRKGRARMHINLFLTFTLGGLWHGATWMFVLWGALHGLAMVVQRTWRLAGGRMPAWLAWFITFNFINVTWVVFRAKDMEAARNVLAGMLGLQGMMPPAGGLPGTSWSRALGDTPESWMGLLGGVTASYVSIGLALLMVLATRNSTGLWMQPGAWRQLTPARALEYGLVAALALLAMLSSRYSEFIYFNF